MQQPVKQIRLMHKMVISTEIMIVVVQLSPLHDYIVPFLHQLWEYQLHKDTFSALLNPE